MAGWKFFGMFGSIFLLAQFLQVIRGYSPLEAGLRTLPWTGMLVLVGSVAGALSDRIGSRSLVVAGMALVVGALAWLAAVATPAVPYAALVAPLVLAGVGMSLFFAPTANAVLSAVSRAEEGKASGVLNTIRQVGGVFGVAVLATVFTTVRGYASPSGFVDGLAWALWAGVAMAGLGAIAALGISGRQATLRHAAVPGGLALVPQRLAVTPGPRRLLTGGVLGGLLGSVCCSAATVAVGLGLGGARFLGTLMDRYQLYSSWQALALWVVAGPVGQGSRDGRARPPSGPSRPSRAGQAGCLHGRGVRGDTGPDDPPVNAGQQLMATVVLRMAAAGGRGSVGAWERARAP